MAENILTMENIVKTYKMGDASVPSCGTVIVTS